MKRTTISIPDKLVGKIKQKVEEEGFLSMTDYIVSLVREDTKGIVVPATIKITEPSYPLSQSIHIPASDLPHASFTFSPVHPGENSQPFPEPVIHTPSSSSTPSQLSLKPLHPKVPVRDPNAPDPYLVYGGKCQYKNINAGNVMCLYQASRKLSVAQNETGDQPTLDQYQQVYLCPDHTSEVSHRSGFFVK